jgi:hypothetical protein
MMAKVLRRATSRAICCDWLMGWHCYVDSAADSTRNGRGLQRIQSAAMPTLAIRGATR